MQTKQTRKSLSLVLAVSMVLAMLPTVAFADSGDVVFNGSKTITAFEPLEAKVAEQSEEIGTTKEELKLPDMLAVTVTESADDAATDSDAPKETQDAVAVTEWVSDPSYDGNAEGVYTFTPTLDLPDGVTLADGVTPPTIIVTVENSAMAKDAVSTDGSGTVTGTMNIGGKSDVSLATDTGGIGWSWTAATATLTLEGSYTGEIISILCATTDNVQLLYSGDVTARDTDGNGLYCSGNLHIGGIGDKPPITGSLTIGGLLVGGALEITQSAVVTVNGNLNGISAVNGLTISGDADVTAVGDTGISTDDGSVTIDTTGSVSATGKKDSYAIIARIGGALSRGQLLVKNGTVTLTQADNPANLYTGELIHTGGTVNGVGVATNAVKPVITTQPQGATVKAGEGVTLRVAATAIDGGTLSYQWYGNSDPEGIVAIPGAIEATYTPSTAAVGTMYYLCTVTNTNNNASGNRTAMIYSSQIAVTVESSGGTGGGSGGGSFITPATPSAPRWLEQNGAATPIAAAKAKGLGYLLTQATGQYGVRKEAWSALAGSPYWHDTIGWLPTLQMEPWMANWNFWISR